MGGSVLTPNTITEALEWERRSDMFLRWAADAERRGEREIARDHFVNAEAHDMQARVVMGLPC